MALTFLTKKQQLDLYTSQDTFSPFFFKLYNFLFFSYKPRHVRRTDGQTGSNTVMGPPMEVPHNSVSHIHHMQVKLQNTINTCRKLKIKASIKIFLIFVK